MIWDFSSIQQKHALTCPGLYRLIFQSLNQTSLILSKQEIDELINFQNFHKLFINKFAAFFGILASHFQIGKTKQSDRAHEACCNVWSSLLYNALGKLI